MVNLLKYLKKNIYVLKFFKKIINAMRTKYRNFHQAAVETSPTPELLMIYQE